MAARLRPAVLLLLPALLALTACSKGTQDADAAAAAAVAAQAVSTAAAAPREMASGVSVSGPVSAVEERQLGL